MVILAGCVGPGRLPFESPKVVEYLDGNYWSAPLIVDSFRRRF
jgi:hypothetical protein